MLEVKNLTKVYKTKGGADVNALDGVTMRFPETGMVFLLGKSGSGKSTLLNVCGGLDSPTSGEIIVKVGAVKAFRKAISTVTVTPLSALFSKNTTFLTNSRWKITLPLP